MQDAQCVRGTVISVIYYPSGHLLEGVKSCLMSGMTERILTHSLRPIVNFITLPLVLVPYEVVRI